MPIETDSELWYFNGIDGSTGGYLTPPMPPQLISEIARREHVDHESLGNYEWS